MAFDVERATGGAVSAEEFLLNCLRAYRRRKHNDPIAGAALAPGAHGGAGRADGHGRPAAGETAPGQDRLAGGGGAPALPRMPAAATPDGEG